MKNKSLLGAVAVAVVALCLISSVRADLKDDIVKLVGDNATSYVHPLTNALGAAMNAGWVNSSKSYSFLKLPFGVQLYFGIPVTMANDDLRTYDFYGTVQTANLDSALSLIPGLPSVLTIDVPDASTIIGDEEDKQVTMQELLVANGVSAADISMAVAAGLDVSQPVFALPGGMPHAADAPVVPMTLPVIGANVGLPFKAQVGLRMVPPLNVPGIGKAGMFGMKLQYEFTDLIPVLGSLPLVHTSAMYSFNNANLFDMLTLKNWQAMLNVSGDFSFLVGLGVYGGIGIQSSTMELSYTVPDDVVGLAGTKVNLEDKGDNSVVAQVGVRFTLSVFDIVADGTFGKTTSYFLGLGLGLNGL